MMVNTEQYGLSLLSDHNQSRTSELIEQSSKPIRHNRTSAFSFSHSDGQDDAILIFAIELGAI